MTSRLRAAASVLLIGGALTVAGTTGTAGAQSYARRLCSVAAYPRLHATLADYGQLRNWRHECANHPREIRLLLRTGCNYQECNYASGLAYRRWIRRFVHTHGGIPIGDLLLGA